MANAKALETYAPPGSGQLIRQLIEQQLRSRVEAWTRFDSRDVEIGGLESGLTDATSKGVFSVSMSTDTASTTGRNGFGRRLDSLEDLFEHVHEDVASLYHALPEKIRSWEQESVDTLLPEFPESLAIAGGESAYRPYECKVCDTKGRVSCPNCGGRGSTHCHVCLHGKVSCNQCSGRGVRDVTCSACNGVGSRTEYVTYQAWDSSTNQYRTQTRSEYRTCNSCGGHPRRTEKCMGCWGAGQVTCNQCNGTTRIPCNTCGQSGSIICTPCAGTGYFHDQYHPDAEVTTTWSRAPLLDDGDDKRVLELAGERFPDFIHAWSPGESTLGAKGAVLMRDWQIPYAKVVVGLNDDHRTAWAIGPEYSLESMDGLGDLLLDNDVADIEAMAARQPSPDDSKRLKQFFESEVNGLAAALLERRRQQADGGNTNDVGALVSQTSGFLSETYIKRVLAAITALVKVRARRLQVAGFLGGLATAAAGLLLIAALSKWHAVPRQDWLPVLLVGVSAGAAWLHARFRSLLSVNYLPDKPLIGLPPSSAGWKAWWIAMAALAILTVWATGRVERHFGVVKGASVSASDSAPEHANAVSGTAVPMNCMPSFSCAGSLTPVEANICSVERLCQLDNQLHHGYTRKLARSGAREARKLRKSQRSWLDKARNTCEDPQCIESAYVTRLESLDH